MILTAKEKEEIERLRKMYRTSDCDVIDDTQYDVEFLISIIDKLEKQPTMLEHMLLNGFRISSTQHSADVYMHNNKFYFQNDLGSSSWETFESLEEQLESFYKEKQP